MATKELEEALREYADIGHEVAGFEDDMREAADQLQRYREENERLREALETLGAGCDANGGGLHSVINPGKDAFCPDCGLMLKRVAYVLPHIKPSDVRATIDKTIAHTALGDD